MNDQVETKTPKKKENPVQRRARVLRQRRLRKLLRTIPKTATLRETARYIRYAALAASLSKKQRRSVAHPWGPRPLDPRVHPEARVARGSLAHAARSSRPPRVSQ